MAGLTAIGVLLLASHLYLGHSQPATTTKSASAAGQQLGVYLDEVNNLGVKYTIRYTLTNGGTSLLDLSDSAIHLCIIRLPSNTTTTHGSVMIEHVDGCYHKINISSVDPLPPSASLQFTATFNNWIVAYTDVMPNWYISYGTNDHALITSTDVGTIEELKGIVAPFTEANQFKRTSSDVFSPWTSEERYKTFMKSFVEVDTTKASLHLIPSPNAVDMDVDMLTTTKYDNSDMWEAIVDGSSDCPINTKCVKITTSAEMVVDEHTITVQASAQGDTITATAGANSTLEVTKTLDQLSRRHQGSLPAGTITMKPRFQYRGYMVDVSRNFQNKQTIMDVLDLMSSYRLNKFHFHLSDDEGWRLAIDGLEELTDNGVKMCFDEEECLYPQLGHKIDKTEFFTKEDYKAILSKAVTLGIEVIPEFDMPAHALAARRAMNIRYKTNPTPDYRLAEEGDESEYSTAQYYTANAVNPCLNSTYAFVKKIIRTVKSYHDEAGSPLQTFHIGFDELPNTAWNRSKACQNFAYDGVDPQLPQSEQLNIYFFKQVSQLVVDHGIPKLGVWEDGLVNNKNVPHDKNTVFADNLEIIGYAWQTVWEWGGGSRPYNLANAGYKVVLAPATRVYLDHPTEPDPENRGYYWATRYIDLMRTFTFRPDDIYANIDFGVMGQPETRASFCVNDKVCPPITEAGRENIIGMEAPLFGETIRTRADLAANTLPRLLAIAERAWSQKEWESTDEATPALYEDYTLFKTSVGKYELPHLKTLKFNDYLISPPGVSVENKKLKVATEFPHQKVWLVRDDGSKMEVLDNTDYTPDKVNFVASDELGERFSRPVVAVVAVVNRSPALYFSSAILLSAMLSCLSLLQL